MFSLPFLFVFIYGQSRSHRKKQSGELFLGGIEVQKHRQIERKTEYFSTKKVPVPTNIFLIFLLAVDQVFRQSEQYNRIFRLYCFCVLNTDKVS